MSLNLAALPFDVESMLAGLRPWVECESPTFDAAAVNSMVRMVARDLAMAGAQTELLPGRRDAAGRMMGDCVRARFAHKNPHAKGVLVLGHFDTVHPIGVLNALPFRHEGARCTGPGICDMKGGNYLALDAMRKLIAAGVETPLPVTFLFTSDEEIGSPTTRDLIEAEAACAAFVLVPEPARPEGGVVTGRYAIARYNLAATGKPSHAGAALSQGRPAIREMARRILEIEEMTGPDCTFSVGVIHGGQWVNCVSTTCSGEALSMAKRQSDLDAGVARMLALSGERDGVQFEVTRGVTRPVWEPDGATLALHAHAELIARSLGFALPHGSAGGGSDGNFTGAMGVPTLDGLGVAGGGYHTLTEYIETQSLVDRARLFAGLLAQLGAA